MKKFRVFAGMGGGFGGAKNYGVYEFKNAEEAEHYAYEMAVQEYQSYEGYHGIISWGDIVDNPEEFGLEEDYTEDDINEIYNEEIDSWISYYVEEVPEDTPLD